MKLINDIVTILMSEDGSLNDALLKTKVLLHDLGHKELVPWVSSEVAGYPREADLPDYRMLSGRIYGNISNGFHTYTKQAIPVMHVDKEVLEHFESADMTDGLIVIEKMVDDLGKNGSMSRPLQPEANQMLGESLAVGYFVQSAWTQIEVAQLRQLLAVVRSRLLDFVLEIRTEFGVNVTEDNIKERAIDMDVPGIFGKAMFGDNTTIIVGNSNQQHVTNTIMKNDAAALAAELRKHGVDEQDISSLQAAIAEDPAPTVAEQYGPAVKGWMTNMMGKAIDTSWKVSIGAAGGVIAGVLKGYYGL
jgi:hypothetical protein